MKTYTVVAYAVNGEVLCPSCIGTCKEPREDKNPIFAGDEFDTVPTCAKCFYEVWDVTVKGE